MIQIPLLNPVRFINLNNINSGFDGNFSLFQYKANTVSKCYFQKFETGDVLKLQVLSTTPPTSLEFRNKYDQAVYTVPWEENTLIIQGYPDLRIYEIEQALLDIDAGNYTLYFTEDLIEYESEPIQIAFKHYGTLLIKYTNSFNNYDAIFDTGIEFQFRVEAEVRNFTPKNDREVYTDQIQNPTQLFSVAYRNFTLFIGYERGVPDWVLDKVNQISQCDQVSYNSIFYQIVDGSEWEVIRIDQYFLQGASIDIQPTDNNFNKYTTVPEESGQTFTPVQKVTPFANGSGNQTITGIFKLSSNLEKVIIYKSGADYTIRIGDTPGGKEIGEFLVDGHSTVKTVEWTFSGNSTVYLSGTGLNFQLLYLVWKQLDEPPIPIGEIEIQDNLPIGAGMFFFEKNAGDLATYFNLATGLGLENTNAANFLIAGTNGWPDMDGVFPVGWDRQDPITIGSQVGSATITIGKENLPQERLALFNTSVATGSNIPTGKNPLSRSRSLGTQSFNYEIAQGSGEPTLGGTEFMGSGTPLQHTPLSRVCVYIIKYK